MYSWKENITAGRYFYAKHDRGGRQNLNGGTRRKWAGWGCGG